MELSLMNQPPYSPDISPCDFFAFAHVKGKLAGMHHSSRDQLLKSLKEIFKDFTPLVLKRVCINWMKRLRFVIGSEGKYYDSRMEEKIPKFHCTYPPKLSS
jgi:hypothetical protein